MKTDYFCQNPKCRANILVDTRILRSGYIDLANKRRPGVTPCRFLHNIPMHTSTRVQRLLIDRENGEKMWACSLCYDTENDSFKKELMK